MYERHEDFDADLALASSTELEEKDFTTLLYKHHGEVAIARALGSNPACPLRLYRELKSYQTDLVEANPRRAEIESDPLWRSLSSPSTRLRRYTDAVSRRRPEAYRLDYIFRHGEGKLTRDTLGVENIPEDYVREHAQSKQAPLRKVVATRETVPTDVFEQLAKDSARTVRATLAANPNAPAHVIGALAADTDADVVAAALANPVCPEEATFAARSASAAAAQTEAAPLAALDFAALARTAADRSTPAEALTALASHEDDCIRFLVGFNANTPAQCLTALARDPQGWVQAGVAFNSSAPPEALQVLRKSQLGDVRMGLASNAALSEADQLALAGAAKPKVARTLANTTGFASVWSNLAGSFAVGKKRAWGHYLAEALAEAKTGKFQGVDRGDKSRQLFVARIAARSEHCPARLAPYLAHYLFEDYSQNPAVALALLEGKSLHKPRPYDEWKLNKWMSEGDAPGHVANFFIRGDDSKRRTQAISGEHTLMVHLLPFVLDPETVARKRLAARQDVVRFVLEFLARDPKPGVREAVARNKSCPKDLLAILAQDKATTVRAAVEARMPALFKTAGKATPVVNQGSATERQRVAKASEDSAKLAALVTDRAASVRLAAVLNSHLDPQVRDSLARDKDAKVRTVVAKRTRDLGILHQLLQDTDAAVRLGATENRRCGYESTSGPNGRLYEAGAMALMVQSEDVALRAVAARFAHSESDQASFLADVPEVTRQLAANRRLVPAVATALVNDCTDEVSVGKAVARTEDEALFLLAASRIRNHEASEPISYNQEMLSRPAVQDALCTHSLEGIRRSLGLRERLTALAYETLKNDESEQVKREMFWYDRRNGIDGQ